VERSRAARGPAFCENRVRCDSPLEGDGFQPSVPRHNKLCVAPATKVPGRDDIPPIRPRRKPKRHPRRSSDLDALGYRGHARGKTKPKQRSRKWNSASSI
jgi:hypothetical protein